MKTTTTTERQTWDRSKEWINEAIGELRTALSRYTANIDAVIDVHGKGGAGVYEIAGRFEHLTATLNTEVTQARNVLADERSRRPAPAVGIDDTDDNDTDDCTRDDKNDELIGQFCTCTACSGHRDTVRLLAAACRDTWDRIAAAFCGAGDLAAADVRDVVGDHIDVNDYLDAWRLATRKQQDEALRRAFPDGTTYGR